MQYITIGDNVYSQKPKHPYSGYSAYHYNFLKNITQNLGVW